MRRFLIALMYLLMLVGCSNHEVDTAEEWCEQISGIDLYDKYAPFWAVFPSVSFNAEAIRDDFVKLLNTSLLQKVEYRSERMAWRDGTDLYMENLSTLLVIEPDEVVSGGGMELIVPNGSIIWTWLIAASLARRRASSIACTYTHVNGTS